MPHLEMEGKEAVTVSKEVLNCNGKVTTLCD